MTEISLMYLYIYCVSYIMCELYTGATYSSKGIFLDRIKLGLFILLSGNNCEAGLLIKLSL